MRLGGSWGEDGNIIAALTITAVCRGFPPLEARPRPSPNWRKEKSRTAGRRFCREARRCCSPRLISGPADSMGPSIEVMSLADRRRKTLVRGGTFGRYLPVERDRPSGLHRTKERCLPCRSISTSWKCAARHRRCWRRSPIALRSASRSSISRGAERWSTAAARGSGLVTVQWLDGDGENAAAAGETGRLWASQPVAGRPAAGPGGDGGIGHRHLGLRLAARHHDALDLRRSRRRIRCGVRTAATSCSERWEEACPGPVPTERASRSH